VIAPALRGGMAVLQAEVSVGQRGEAARLELTAVGWDVGPVTIAWHLERAGLHAPSTSTIRRILHAAGPVTPEPRKRPRSSCRRFQADQPNQCWQSDFTHWPLAGGTGAEIISWLDDHSRYLLACSAWAPVTGTVVASTFLRADNAYGLPASTLTDNGRACTARARRRPERLRVPPRRPRHHPEERQAEPPPDQGKVERFHQTQKRWLAQQPSAATLGELQRQLDAFREHYNEHRPNRALQRSTPGRAYRALPKGRTRRHPARPLPAAL
jgi:transposase InsO family protein